QQALEWLLHQGLEWQQGMRVMGLDDFLEQLREEMRARYRDVNLRHALGEIRDKLEGLLDLERDALDDLDDRTRAARKRDLLDRLPHRLSEALGRLREYDFEDAEAANALEALLDELDDIRDLEDFTRRYGDLFHGPRALSYEEALALMRSMERLKRLEEQLLSGDLDAVDPESLRELLGIEAGQNFQLLKDVMLLLVKAGYLTQRQGRVRLSPKGVRKIGQLALPARLLRDRRLLHPCGRAEAAGPPRGELEHGRPVHEPPGRPACRGRPARPPSEQQPAHHRHHRRPADGLLPARAPLLRVAA